MEIDERWSDEVWVDDGPDALDLVREVDDMVAIFAAQRYERVDALRREAMTDAARFGSGLPEVVARAVRLELAAALRVTEHRAATLIARAESLVHRYPTALDSLGRARMTEQHAETLVDHLDALAPEVRERVLPAAVQLAEAQPFGVFRRKLRDLVETERLSTLSERHSAALRRRRVAVQPDEDGMAWLTAYLPAVEAHAIHGRLTAMAKALDVDDRSRDERSLDELRADVLCDLLVDGEVAAHPARARGIRPTVVVTVPALSLLGDDSTGAAVVEGLGPIPIDSARELCGGAKGWTRVLTHPETGIVLSVGRTRYRPPPSLRRLAQWRADRCMAPGCGIPASRCQIDHSIAWEHGGTTSLPNLGPLCTGHHTIKHHGGWTLRQFDDGTIEWTSPLRRRYVVAPERRVPVFRPTVSGDAPF